MKNLRKSLHRFAELLPTIGGEREGLFGLAAAISLSFWLQGAGMTLPQTFASVFTVFVFGLWGLTFARLLGPQILNREDQGLWLFGPCVSLGALWLFVVRLVTDVPLFFVVFFAAPVVWSVCALVNTPRVLAQVVRIRVWAGPLAVHSLLILAIVGLMLLQGWTWVAPIVLVSLVSLVSLFFRRGASSTLSPEALVAWFCVLVVSLLVVSMRTDSWWQLAKGIPYDETILESISNGLVQWGPYTNPLHYGLDGQSSVAYHHLLYLIVGVTGRLSRSSPYEALTIVGPLVSRISIVSTLLLLLRVVQRKTKSTVDYGVVSIISLAACAIALRGEGFGSPSSWMGVAALLGSLLIVVEVAETQAPPRLLALLAASIVAVAFSKGVFIYVPAVLGFTFALWKKRVGLRIGLVSITSAIASTVWFVFASVRDDEFRIEFWPYRNMESSFSVSPYALLVFLNRLVNPVLLGLICCILIAIIGKLAIRRLGVSLILTLVAAIGSQVFITSDGPRSFELFYVPGVVASSLGLLILGAISDSGRFLRSGQIFFLLLVSVVIVWVESLVQSETIDAYVLTVAVVTAFLVAKWLIDGRQKRERTPGHAPLALVSLFPSVVLVAIVHQDLTSPDNKAKVSEVQLASNWYGSSAFGEAVEYLRANSTSNDLIAYSLCGEEGEVKCEADFRPAALTGRRFLALDPLFSPENVDDVTWNDVVLSRSIGVGPVSSTIRGLRSRGVQFIFAKRMRVDDSWINDAEKAGSKLEFANSEFAVISLFGGDS